MNRYKQLIDIVREKQPKVILEVGTWNGGRALEMLEAAPDAEYWGFDLFEGATEQTDIDEFNVKAHYSKSTVALRLAAYKAVLCKGNTRGMLPIFARNMLRRVDAARIDLAFIDGGHSVETIASDWKNILPVMRKGGTIVLDDFYSAMSDNTLAYIGCNSLVAEMNGAATILPVADPVAGGGFVQMVRVDL